MTQGSVTLVDLHTFLYASFELLIPYASVGLIRDRDCWLLSGGAGGVQPARAVALGAVSVESGPIDVVARHAQPHGWSVRAAHRKLSINAPSLSLREIALACECPSLPSLRPLRPCYCWRLRLGGPRAYSRVIGTGNQGWRHVGGVLVHDSLVDGSSVLHLARGVLFGDLSNWPRPTHPRRASSRGKSRQTSATGLSVSPSEPVHVLS